MVLELAHLKILPQVLVCLHAASVCVCVNHCKTFVPSNNSDIMWQALLEGRLTMQFPGWWTGTRDS